LIRMTVSSTATWFGFAPSTACRLACCTQLWTAFCDRLELNLPIIYTIFKSDIYAKDIWIDIVIKMYLIIYINYILKNIVIRQIINRRHQLVAPHPPIPSRQQSWRLYCQTSSSLPTLLAFQAIEYDSTLNRNIFAALTW
jgi:hypothetical protein